MEESKGRRDASLLIAMTIMPRIAAAWVQSVTHKTDCWLMSAVVCKKATVLPPPRARHPPSAANAAPVSGDQAEVMVS